MISPDKLFEAERRCTDPEVQRRSCLLGEGPEDVWRHQTTGGANSELERLYCLARLSQARKRSYACRALSWIGHRLTVWGSRLLARYESAAEPAAMGVAQALRR